jgi:hypothetical protein
MILTYKIKLYKEILDEYKNKIENIEQGIDNETIMLDVYKSMYSHYSLVLKEFELFFKRIFEADETV